MGNSRNTIQGINLIKNLAEQGYRIFDINLARNVGKDLGFKYDQIKQQLYLLKLNGWIESICRGKYVLNSLMLAGNPIHEYEVAMEINEQAAIAYFSAMHFHGLTQQIPHKVFVLTTTQSKLPKNTVGSAREIIMRDIHYHVISVKEEFYFGTSKYWIGSSRVNITDLERTLLDMITKPKYCGDFGEVIEGYKLALDKINYEKLVSYACKLGNAAKRRLGWVLDYLEVDEAMIVNLKGNYIGYIKLNASGDNKGGFNRKWGIRVNL